MTYSIIQILRDALMAEHSKQRDEVHVSDLVLCQRQAAYRKKFPLPPTDKEINYFSSGKGIHSAIQSLIAADPDRFEVEKEVRPLQCAIPVGHVDVYDRINNIPIEAKSARVRTIEQPYDHHVLQLKMYMAMLGSDTGLILYQCLLNSDDKPFVEFVINMTGEERLDLLDWMGKSAAEFKTYTEEGAFFLIPAVLKNQEKNWLCKSCPYLEKCKQAQKDIELIDDLRAGIEHAQENGNADALIFKQDALAQKFAELKRKA